jgi:tetratricopeptide (TPR) repeat protein
VIEKIGSGGIGVVYLAEQFNPVRRRVAVKVIRSGMSTEEVMSRFEMERQALALMDHPGIAKVFDAGMTNDGRPYFAMEYVPGIPITEYCDRNRLPVRKRLELFTRVCDAVQHAHQKGVIHRDIKPSNVLVEVVAEDPVPKVIDFGVAKATAQHLSENVVFTEQGQLLGTPEYMSPEQAEMTGLNIDTRTDVYSLGTLLYELLTGSLPFDSRTLRSAGYAGIQRILRDEEPEKPSSRLTTLAEGASEVAHNRQVHRGKLHHRLRGDLDWITMKALEKDRTRRYASASELAADVRRHLHDDPVMAGPPSVLYRLGKFRRRHRALVAGAAAVVLALLAGVGATTWQAVRARRAEERATAEASVAKAVNRFLTDMLAEASPEANPLNREMSVREALDDAAARIEGSFQNQPAIRAAVQNTIGTTYMALGLYDAADPHLRSALEFREGRFGPGSSQTAESRHSLGRLLWSRSDFESAESLIRNALETYRRTDGEESEGFVACLTDLAVVQQSRGDFDGAEATLRETLERSRALFGDESRQVADNLNNLAWIRRSRGDLAEAEALLREAFALNRRLLGREHPSVLIHGLNLAAILRERNALEEAEQLYAESIDLMREVLGPEHPTTLRGMKSMGEMFLQQREIERAESLLRDALEADERTLGPDNSLTMTLLADVGWTLRLRGDLAGAEPYYRKTLERRIRTLGEEHPHTIRARWQVSRLLVDQGKFEEGERSAREALDAGRRVLPAENENVASALVFLGLALVGLDRCGEAEPVLRECLEARQSAHPPGAWEVAQAKSGLGAALTGQGRYGEAEELLLDACRSLKEDGSAPPIRLRKALDRIVELYVRWDAADPDIDKSDEVNRWSAELRALAEAR